MEHHDHKVTLELSPELAKASAAFAALAEQMTELIAEFIVLLEAQSAKRGSDNRGRGHH